MCRFLSIWSALVLALLPTLAHAWWNGDWAHRKSIFIDTRAFATDAQQGVADIAVPVRLHTGNFAFAEMQPDASDLRFVAADDKTPLMHHIEKLDAAAGVAIVWVHVPMVALGRPELIYMYYGNPNATGAENSAAGYDRDQVLVLHLNEAGGMPRDATAYANHAARNSAGPAAPGALDTGADFGPGASIVVPAAAATRLAPGRGFTFSAWIRIEGDQDNAAVFTQQEGGAGVQIGVNGTALFARVGSSGGVAEIASAGRLEPGQWHHIAVTLSDRLSIFVDGREVATTPAAMPAAGGEIVVGTPANGRGLVGVIDEVQVATVARSADWVQLAAMLQRPGSDLVAVGESEAGSGVSARLEIYRVLARAVTLDGWIIIGVIVVLGLLAGNVVITKTFALSRMEAANRAFMRTFRQRQGEMLTAARGLRSAGAAAVDPAGAEAKLWRRHSCLYRLYQSGVEEARELVQAQRSGGGREVLDAEDLAVVRARLDAGMVEEVYRLNGRLVLLTITISGAPFFGLLGTVVGIMMTFGAIAASGDVNVSTIAPGVAAALTTTVTGLLVAIPVMFAYNHIVTKVRGLTRLMEVFSNELVGKLARVYGGAD
jgi:biopolymer transport protein ExbB